MSPYEISILLHIFTRPSNFSESCIDNSTDVFKETISNFVDDLIEYDLTNAPSEHGFRLVTKGRLYIESILQVTPPRTGYIDNDENIIHTKKFLTSCIAKIRCVNPAMNLIK